MPIFTTRGGQNEVFVVFDPLNGVVDKNLIFLSFLKFNFGKLLFYKKKSLNHI